MSTVQFSGLASGIDSAALIDAVVQSRQIRNDIRKNQISELQSQSEALREFKTKLVALNDLIDKFRTANGGGVAKKAASSDNSVLTAAASPTAINGTYDMEVFSVAKAATGALTPSFSSLDSFFDPVTNGSIQVRVGSGAHEIVIHTETYGGVTTVSDFVAAFNANPATHGRVVASTVNVGSEESPAYKVVFNTLESGLSKGQLAVDYEIGGSATEEVVSQATDAVFSIDGIGTISRSTNVISDVIPGMTFSLAGTGTATVSVSNDPDKTFNEAQEFVDAYNDIVKFLNENNTVERVESGNNVRNIFGSLAKTRVDRDFISVFRANISSATSSSGSEVKSLAQMGFVTNRDGTITLREDEFKAAVQKDILGATQTLNNFADTVSGIGGSIYQFTKFNGTIDITLESNNNQIENISRAIAQLDRQTDKIREGMTLRFARLESTTGRLQSQQQALSGILAGLNG